MQLAPLGNTLSAGEQLVDLRRLSGTLLRFKWRIFALAILSAVLAAVIAQQMTPVYRATATLLLEAQQARAIKIEEVYGFNSAQQEYYLTQFEILKSRSVAERVFDQLALTDHQALQSTSGTVTHLKKQLANALPQLGITPSPQLTQAQRRKSQLDMLARNIQINPVKKTQLVNLSFESSDPQLAQDVANAIGDAYIDSQLDARVGITQKASNWLGGRLAELRQRLETAELKLEAFRQQHNLVDVEGVTALDARELERLNDDMTDARAKKANADGFLALIRYVDQNDIKRLESLPEITSHPSVQNVKREVITVERKLSELSKVYGPKHPKMISAQAELSTVNRSLQQQIIRLIEGIEKEAEQASQQLASLDQQFQRTKAAYAGMGGVESEYRRLQREVETNRVLFDSFFARQKETEVTGDFDAPIARFTDRAQLPASPVKPNKKLIVLSSFILALLAGCAIALLQESLSDTIKTTDDIENRLSQCNLGYLPAFSRRLTMQQRTFAYFDSKQRHYAESVRNIRTTLTLMALDKSFKVIEITSSNPEEGKTSVSLDLAFAFSSLERVLLIDADLRKPAIAGRLKLPPYQNGLSNALAGVANIDECIVKTVRENVDVMTSGAIPINPLELLAGDMLPTLLAQLKQRYDKIIIDTAPVQAVSDPLLLAKYADAVVLVVKANHSRCRVIKQTLGRLQQAKARIYGVVLNGLVQHGVTEYYGNYGYNTEQQAELQRASADV